MTVVLETETALPVAREAAPDEREGALDTLETIIAAHRAALVDLAPHQRERSVRVDTGWHMEELGLLLGLRDQATGDRRQATGGRKEDRDRDITRR